MILRRHNHARAFIALLLRLVLLCCGVGPALLIPFSAASAAPSATVSRSTPVDAAQSARPNIVFIYTDDQASWTLGCYGNREARTPHLDRLAAQGARLTDSLVSTPVCSPARASLFTSRYASEVGVLDFITDPGHKAYTPEVGAIGLEPRFVAFPELLAAAGYNNALIGKWHVGDWTRDPSRRFHPTLHGFHFFMGLTGGGCAPANAKLEKDGEVREFKGLSGDVLTEEAVAFLERPHEKPFFLMLSLRSPHGPWLPVAPEDAAPYEKLDPTLPHPDYPDLNVSQMKRMMREYLSSVSGVDRNVGTVLAALDRLKLADRTIVVFSSDNGFMVGHNGLYHKGNGIWATRKAPPPRPPNITGRYRPNLYDNSLRVPAIVRWPGVIRPGTIVTRVVSNLDWFPTFLAMAGVPLPKEITVRGRDITPLLRGETVQGWDDVFFGEYSMRVYCRTDMRTLRTERWKLVRDFLNEGRDELYDLKADPEETRNRIADDADPEVRAALADLDARLLARMRALNDPALALARGR